MCIRDSNISVLSVDRCHRLECRQSYPYVSWIILSCKVELWLVPAWCSRQCIKQVESGRRASVISARRHSAMTERVGIYPMSLQRNNSLVHRHTFCCFVNTANHIILWYAVSVLCSTLVFIIWIVTISSLEYLFCAFSGAEHVACFTAELCRLHRVCLSWWLKSCNEIYTRHLIIIFT